VDVSGKKKPEIYRRHDSNYCIYIIEISMQGHLLSFHLFGHLQAAASAAQVLPFVAGPTAPGIRDFNS